MTTAAEYRARAEEFVALAKHETDPASRYEYERLAQCYARLANMAERNSLTDLVYETPVRKDAGDHADPIDPAS